MNHSVIGGTSKACFPRGRRLPTPPREVPGPAAPAAAGSSVPRQKLHLPNQNPRFIKVPACPAGTPKSENPYNTELKASRETGVRTMGMLSGHCPRRAFPSPAEGYHSISQMQKLRLTSPNQGAFHHAPLRPRSGSAALRPSPWPQASQFTCLGTVPGGLSVSGLLFCSSLILLSAFLRSASDCEL